MLDRVIDTTCRLCLNGCGVRLHVQGDRIVRVEGRKDHPFSQGGLCPKAHAAQEVIDSPLRLKKPLLRTGERGAGKWKEITWDEALDYLSEKLIRLKRDFGPEQFGVFRGQGPGWGLSWDYLIRFVEAFGCTNIFATGHVCYVPRFIAQMVTFGPMIPNGWAPVEEYSQAECLVEWGANFTATNVPRMKHVLAAKRRGARLIVVDPFPTRLSSAADLWVRPRPGTDGLVAMSMANVIISEQLYDARFIDSWTEGFDSLKNVAFRYPPEATEKVTGVPASALKEFAKVYALTKPATLYVGGGIDRYPDVLQTTRAISLLPVLTGNIDIPGGTPIRRPLRGNSVRQPARPFNKSELRDIYPLMYEYFRQVPGSLLADAVLDPKLPPVKMLMVVGGNPAVCLANSNRVREALNKLDFLVVHDLLLTQTARLADLVLPAASCYERLEVEMLEDMVLLREPFVHMDGCKSDLQLVLELASRIGLENEFPWKTEAEAVDYYLEPLGLSVNVLSRDPGRGLVGSKNRYKKYEQEGFGTPTGKAELYSTVLDKCGYDPIPFQSDHINELPGVSDDFPLFGASGPTTPYYVHAQYRHIASLRKHEQEPEVRVNPSDALKRGISSGDVVEVRSKLGCITMKAKVTPDMPEGYVLVPFGWGESMEDANLNTIIDDQIRDPVCGTTVNRLFPCQVSPVKKM